jgi:hypothetical protein
MFGSSSRKLGDEVHGATGSRWTILTPAGAMQPPINPRDELMAQ